MYNSAMNGIFASPRARQMGNIGNAMGGSGMGPPPSMGGGMGPPPGGGMGPPPSSPGGFMPPGNPMGMQSPQGAPQNSFMPQGQPMGQMPSIGAAPGGMPAGPLTQAPQAPRAPIMNPNAGFQLSALANGAQTPQTPNASIGTPQANTPSTNMQNIPQFMSKMNGIYNGVANMNDKTSPDGN